MTERLLARESKYFASIRKVLQANGHTGKWVCIVGNKLVGVYDRPFDALEAGIAMAGARNPFLIDVIPKPSAVGR